MTPLRRSSNAVRIGLGRLGLGSLGLVALAGCSLFSQTPDPATRNSIRTTITYGMSADVAASKMSGLGFACSRHTGNYLDETGHTRQAEHFLFCEQRPGVVSFTCLNRDQATLVLRDDTVAGIEVVRGPSCERN